MNTGLFKAPLLCFLNMFNIAVSKINVRYKWSYCLLNENVRFWTAWNESSKNPVLLFAQTYNKFA